MTFGVPLGVWDPHEFTSDLDLLAGGLTDGALWILIDGTGPIDAGIWPDTPRNGGVGGGGCLPDDPIGPIVEVQVLIFDESSPLGSLPDDPLV